MNSNFIKILSICLLTLGISVGASAQTRIVKGKVIADGEGIMGVSVKLKGTTRGVTTILDGTYSLQVPESGGTLVFSFIGYATVEEPIKGRSVVNVVLRSDAKTLNEVVVVGYGSQKRRDVTGAVSSISGRAVENTPVASANALLQGRAAGVQVVQNSGAPGGGVSVRIRGNTSIGASNEPLYVIDGVPVKSEDNSGLNDASSGASASMNPLASINPNDIESMEILKDASSAAIYGARAANGVVLITTKRGKAGVPTISFNAYTGISNVIKRIPTLNARQYRDFLNEANQIANRAPETFTTDSLNPYFNGDVFWQDEIFNKAQTQNYDFSVRGGREGATYAFSTNYYDQEGVVLGTRYRRLTTRFNNDFKLSSKFSLGQSLFYARGDNNRTSTGESNRSTVYFALVKAPVFPIYAPDGSYIPKDNIDRNNPIAVADLAHQSAITNRFTGNVYGQFDFNKNLFMKTSVQLDLENLKEDQFFPNTIDQSENRRGSSQTTIDNDVILEHYFSYNRDLSTNGRVSFLLGASQQLNKQERTFLVGEGSPTNDITTLNAATLARSFGTFETNYGISSIFSRANLSLLDRYLFTFNARRDASSRFGANNKVAYFPSASFGWRVSSEPFMEGINFLSDLKFRVSAGAVGNQNGIGNYTAQGAYRLGFNYNGVPGIAPATNGLANADLSWERTKDFNLGLDVGILNNRISVVLDYYNKLTTDLLLQADVPRSSGFERVLRNVGSIRNRGVEFTITSTNINSKRFNWTTTANIASNRTEVVKLNDGETELGVAGLSYSLTRVGLPVGTFYGWQAEGIYARDADNVNQVKNSNGRVFKGGDVIFKDINGDNIINDLDRTIIGDPTPDFVGGFTNTFKYKAFALSVFNQFSVGNDIYNAVRKRQNDMGGGNNPTTAALDAWKKQGDVTSFPLLERGDPRVQNGRHSSRWVEDGSYFRFKNVSLTYNLPTSFLERFKMRSMSVYAQAYNLLTFTKYSGFDPEVNTYASPLGFGVDNGVFPQSRTYTFGLNLGL
jgi:TonB-dependent starch-binding outer membrane protein SusC